MYIRFRLVWNPFWFLNWLIKRTKNCCLTKKKNSTCNKQETFDQSHPTLRATTTKTGLRRPDYGPMQSHVFRNQPTTPHVISRRTLVDESLIEAMIHTHLRAPGTGSTNFTATHRNDDAMVNQRTTVEEPKEPSRSTWDDNLFAAAVSESALILQKSAT